MIEQRRPTSRARRRPPGSGRRTSLRALRAADRRTTRRARRASRRKSPLRERRRRPDARLARQRGLDRHADRVAAALGREGEAHRLEVDEQRVGADVVGLAAARRRMPPGRARQARRTCGRARGRRRRWRGPCARSIAMNACQCSIVILGSPPPLSTRLPCSTPCVERAVEVRVGLPAVVAGRAARAPRTS